MVELSGREAGPEAGVCHERPVSSARLVSPASYPDGEEGLEARLLLSRLKSPGMMAKAPTMCERELSRRCLFRWGISEWAEKLLFRQDEDLRMQGVTLQTGSAKGFFG